MHETEKVAFLLRKWNNQNEGLTTPELKELRLLLSSVREQVSETIAYRIEEEEKEESK